MHGVEEDQPIGLEQALEQGRKAFLESGPAAPGLARQSKGLIGEGKPGERGRQFFEAVVEDRHLADGLMEFVAGLGLDLERLAGVIEHPGVVDLGQVMILGRQPEDRHCARALLPQLLG